MPKELYINAWKASKATLQINNAIDNRSKGINGIANYRLPDTNLNRVPYALAYAMGFQRGSDTSWYQLFIPPMNNEVIKVRISDHKSTKTEWPPIEDCLPNRRYSVVIFNEKSMHIQKESHIKYVDWVRYDVEGIPVYEIMIYCGILPLVWTYLYKIFTSLYNGGHPESNLIKDYFHLKSDDKNKPINDVVAQWNKTIDKNTNESKTYKNMKKNVQRINESQLRAIVAESVKKVLKESHSMEIETALQDICRASSLIRNKTEYTQEEDYEPNYEIGYNDAAYLHKWASEIEEQAGEWLRN